MDENHKRIAHNVYEGAGPLLIQKEQSVRKDQLQHSVKNNIHLIKMGLV